MPEHRRKRLRDLIDNSYGGSRKAFCDASIMSESRVAQLLSTTYRDGGEFGEKAARSIEKKLGLPTMYFDQASDELTAQQVRAPYEASHNNIAGRSPVRAMEDDEQNPNIAKIRKVKLRLSAGIVGFSADPEEEDGNPIYFRRNWLASRGYKPENLIAIRVKGESMEPNLHAGDTVVINTADTVPKDGEVFAINYEGEDVVKRLVRDAGTWWLSSDNTDQRRFQRKECTGDMCLLLGRVIHKQSERI